ncbi:MAG: adenylyl-sulfate kinase, partial [Candidatus Microthrix sp.]|nr:adenylyl-sulfate kinase [Candidatus Microthrix sp.]
MSTSTAVTAPPARSSWSTRTPTPPSAPAWCWAKPSRFECAVTDDVTWHAGQIDADARAEALGHRGAVVWLTGLSGSGKSTLAVEV